MREIRQLVDQNLATMEAFSGEAHEGLRAAREKARTGLRILRQAAQCAESCGQQIQQEAGALESRVAEVRRIGEQLEGCLARLAHTLREIDAQREAEASALSGEAARRDETAIEMRFGSAYTTEMERAVLRAALAGGPLPAAETVFAGNAVELF